MSEEINKRNIDTLAKVTKDARNDIEELRQTVVRLQAEIASVNQKLQHSNGQIAVLLAKSFSGGPTSGH
jgi:prefoldin subunit 5